MVSPARRPRSPRRLRARARRRAGGCGANGAFLSPSWRPTGCGLLLRRSHRWVNPRSHAPQFPVKQPKVTAMEFRILGPLAVSDAVSLPSGKPRTLLLALLLRRNAVVPTDLLIEDLW